MKRNLMSYGAICFTLLLLSCGNSHNRSSEVQPSEDSLISGNTESSDKLPKKSTIKKTVNKIFTEKYLVEGTAHNVTLSNVKYCERAVSYEDGEGEASHPSYYFGTMNNCGAYFVISLDGTEFSYSDKCPKSLIDQVSNLREDCLLNSVFVDDNNGWLLLTSRQIYYNGIPTKIAEKIESLKSQNCDILDVCYNNKGNYSLYARNEDGTKFYRCDDETCKFIKKAEKKIGEVDGLFFNDSGIIATNCNAGCYFVNIPLNLAEILSKKNEHEVWRTCFTNEGEFMFNGVAVPVFYTCLKNKVFSEIKNNARSSSRNVSTDDDDGYVSIPQQQTPCFGCAGTRKCSNCNGRGTMLRHFDASGDTYVRKCGACGGSGICPQCNGTGISL